MAAAAGSMDLPVLEARDVTKEYVGGDGSRLRVLDGVSLAVGRGEMVAIVGESGAGKSTLLHVLGALDRPSGGDVRVADEALAGRSEAALAEVRNRFVGFVFQFHHLLREFTALENVMMPLQIGGLTPRAARERAGALLDRVGLAARMHHRPAALSGGEQQRAAVARALAVGPAVLLADEPSGNLDQANAERLHELFAGLARDQQLGLVVVTHNPALAGRAQRVLRLEHGRLVDGTGTLDRRASGRDLTRRDGNGHLAEPAAVVRGLAERARPGDRREGGNDDLR